MASMTAGWAGATSGPTHVQERARHCPPAPIRSEKIHDPYETSSVSTRNGTAGSGTYLVLSESIVVVATDTTWEGSRSVALDGRDRRLDAAFAASAHTSHLTVKMRVLYCQPV